MNGVWTAIIGVAAFILGQAILRFVVEPIFEQRRLIGEIASAVVYLGNVGPVSSPQLDQALYQPDEKLQASRLLRSHAAKLRASLWAIPLYGLWSVLRFVRPRGVVLKASGYLIGWSNSLHSGQPGAFRDKLSALLKLPAE